ncbi:MAG TPA: hypothetical protein VGN16_06005 [Acidobacteriaceae bacterium]|jgi:hypothetical protein
MRWKENTARRIGLFVFAGALFGSAAMSAPAQCSANCSGVAEANNMDLVGYNDLQGRTAYIPTIEKQGDRWIAYIGVQADSPRLNPLTGKVEPPGTLIIDVTDPRHPTTLFHIPGEQIKRADIDNIKPPGTAQEIVSTGAQFARVCSGDRLPHGEKGKYYLLRGVGKTTWETWDVTDPAKPSRLALVVNGIRNLHNGWWECDTGIAYVAGGPLGWRIPPPPSDRLDGSNHTLIYDLSDPTKPVFIRTFGLPGQEPGSAFPIPTVGAHHMISTGPKGNRVYYANGDAGSGFVEIVDREKLLNGPKDPNDANLQYPVIGKIDLPADIGADMAFPMLGMHLPEFAKQKDGFVKDFLAVIGQSHNNVKECRDSRQMMHIFDITTESKPVGISTWTVPEASGNFCSRGGMFGTHSSNESFTPIYYNRILLIAHHNSGVRAVDIRDPYHPTEIGYYIPAVNERTRPSCVEGEPHHCKIVIDTNNLEVDDRGFIYAVDFAGTGMHILELTGPARLAANFSAIESPENKLGNKQ